MLTKIVAIGALLGGHGCGSHSPLSTPKEAPDSYNTIDNFSIFKAFTYDDLRLSTTVTLPDVPWADTYWPYDQQGLAQRWTDDLNDHAKDLPGEIKLGAFLERFAGEVAKRQPDPLMSPAEKYDVVFAYRHGMKLPADKLKALSTSLTTQDAAIKAQTAIPAKLPLLQTMYDTFLGDDNLKLDQAMSMTVNSWKSYLDGNLDPKNKYLSAAANPGLDWSWQGHCHGWAPAAAMTLPPTHSVMAIIGTQQVFFSEGDLRGLMTKAWADSAPEDSEGFIGRRCYEGANEKSPIPSNANGRGYSGRLQMTKDGSVEPIIVLDTLPNLLPVKLHGKERNLTIYFIRLDQTGEKKYLVEHVRGGGDPDATPDEYWVANAFADITRSLKDADPLSALQKPYNAQLTGCWDANPASFHEALVEQIGQKKLGFVMNRTRVAQVWNQPIYSAAFTVGKLQPLGSVSDVAAMYRASGTAYVAQVHASVSYTDEPDNPELTYPSTYDLESQTTAEYDYTLEFDEGRRVIGGEWGTFAKIDPAAPSPDFLFAFPKGSTPYDALDDNTDFENASIDYTGIIAKLHDCGRNDTTDGQITLLGETLSYSNCVIDPVR